MKCHNCDIEMDATPATCATLYTCSKCKHNEIVYESALSLIKHKSKDIEWKADKSQIVSIEEIVKEMKKR